MFSQSAIRQFARARKAIMQVTPSASKRITELLAKQHGKGKVDVTGVKVGIRTRGCNGLSYTMDYSTNPAKFDEVIETPDGQKVVVDSKAVMFLVGSTMDFVDTDLGSEFVFNNPNKKSECGCGQSFTV